MKIKFLFTFFLCAGQIFAQIDYTLTIKQAGNCYPAALIAHEDHVFLAYTVSQGVRKTAILKIDKEGVITDSLVFNPQQDTTFGIWDIGKTDKEGVYFGCGVRFVSQKTCYVWAFEFDNDLQILWERIIDSVSSSPTRMHHQAVGKQRYITYSEVPKIYLYRFDTEPESEIFKNVSYSGIIDYLCPIPNGSSFLMNNPRNPSNILVVDQDFKQTGEVIVPFPEGEHINQPFDCAFINEKEFVNMGNYYAGDYQRKYLSVIKTDTALENIQQKVFGHEGYEYGFGCMSGVNSSLAMHSDYFFAVGTAWLVSPVPTEHFDNFVMLYVFNHDLDPIWSMNIGEQDGSYYMAWSIAPTPDGGCVIGLTKHDWHEKHSAYADAYIVKIPYDFVGISEQKPSSRLVSVFPNPGNDRFYLETELSGFTFQLFTAEGRLLLEQRNQKEVNTENLTSGFYVYRIVSDTGATSSGKWVKL